MIRKSVFWGLTILLVVALVNLFLRERRIGKPLSGKPVEIIQESPSTPIRVLKPKDLKVAFSKMHLEKRIEGDTQSVCARHEIKIFNKSNISYLKVLLSIDYTDRTGKVLTTRSYVASGPLLPGGELHLVDVRIEDLPVQTVNCRIAIIYAEMESESRSK
jgi:hypothetical protein